MKDGTFHIMVDFDPLLQDADMMRKKWRPSVNPCGKSPLTEMELTPGPYLSMAMEFLDCEIVNEI